MLTFSFNVAFAAFCPAFEALNCFIEVLVVAEMEKCRCLTLTLSNVPLEQQASSSFSLGILGWGSCKNKIMLLCDINCKGFFLSGIGAE